MNLLLSVVALTAAALGWIASAVAPAAAAASAGPVAVVVLLVALPIVLGCKRRRDG